MRDTLRKKMPSFSGLKGIHTGKKAIALDPNLRNTWTFTRNYAIYPLDPKKDPIDSSGKEEWWNIYPEPTLWERLHYRLCDDLWARFEKVEESG